MNDNLQEPRAAQRGSREERGLGSTWHALLLCLALLSFGVGNQWSKSRQDPAENSTPDSAAVATADQADGTKASAPGVVPHEEEIEVRDGADQEEVEPAAPREIETISRPGLQPAMQTQQSEPSPVARQLVTSLTQLDFNRGPLTVEQAAVWKESLQQLIQQGGLAVPAIQEFLQLNRDWDFGAANPLGYPSLRTAFLDALGQIGGPESQGLLLQTLQTTAVPSEIARVARALEQAAPGQFHEEIRTAVRETLAQAAAGQMQGWDMGPLFQVLQQYGNANAVPDLEKSATRWNYYSTLALANLPGGAGVATLVQLAQESSGSGARGAAVEALAQVAVQYPIASAALIDLARSAQLSERNWIAVTAALEGNRYSIHDSGLENAGVPIGSGVKTYSLARSNQHFYSTPAWGGMSMEQTQQRIAIIDQLLALSPSSTVAQALQNARTSLTSAGQQANAN